MSSSHIGSKIAPAIIKAQSEMGNARKGSTNPFFKSKYADLNSIREAVMPALHENGIAVLQPTIHLDNRNFVETILIHTSGETYSGLTEIISSKPNDPQAQGSAISYARRYGLQSILNIGAEDDDGEHAVSRGAVAASQEFERKPSVKTSPNSDFPKCNECGSKMLPSKFKQGDFYCPNKKNHQDDLPF